MSKFKSIYILFIFIITPCLKAEELKLPEDQLKNIISTFDSKLDHHKNLRKAKKLISASYSALFQSYINAETEGQRFVGDFNASLESLTIKEGDDALDIADKVLENAISSNLDAHTLYFNKDNFKNFRSSLNGVASGLGILTSKDKVTKQYTVQQVIAGSPAEGKLMQGDMITKINDTPTKGLDINEFKTTVKSLKGESVTVRILRNNKSQDIEIKPSKFSVKSYNISYLENDVMYLQIYSFNLDLFTAINREIRQYKDYDTKGIIIDLRNNGGGLLFQAALVANLFLDQGKIVGTSTRGTSNIKYYYADASSIFEGVPMAIIVNPLSASASEVFASAMQDNNRATIIGEQTFGKGSVQVATPMPYGRGLVITTSTYYTPSGSSVQLRGVTPDIKYASPWSAQGGLIFRESDMERALKVDNLPTYKKRKTKAIKTCKDINNDVKINGIANKDKALLCALRFLG